MGEVQAAVVYPRLHLIYALLRVLRETSSRYLLGVEPQASDRDGRVRELRVRVRQRGVTVRGRSWVALQ